jgi:hypothetical protein
MRRMPFILALLYSFFALSGRVYAIGERTLTLGSGSWELMETKQGIIEAAQIRPHPVLVLSSQTGKTAGLPWEVDPLDLYLSFDELSPGRFSDSGNCYDISVSQDLARAASPWSRVGAGAALFRGGNTGEPLVLRPRANAMLAAGSHIRDFSIEFWLFPQNLENGEQILSWVSSKADGRGGYINQRVLCAASRNRLTWSFTDFFFSSGEKERKSVSLTGSVLLNRTWSHHLVRFDANTGILEYLVDGRVEALDYASSTGHERGEVFTPVIGEEGRLSLGGRFSGMMDEFRVHRLYLEKAGLAKYPGRGGRAESRTLDLGFRDSQVLKIEAFGGRTFNNSNRIRNEYTADSGFSFPDHGAIHFFIRINNDPYRWNDVPWIPITPGTSLPDSMKGRFVMIAADFYPGEDGEASPYLAELRLIYSTAEPPPPPAQISVTAKNGAVELSWRASPARDIGGYFVYYGTARGEYFGDHATLGSAVYISPIDVGNRTSIRIEGLNNGTLYYFAVAAYGEPGGNPVPEPGAFSREVAARPLRMAE